jgi:hypothetical protein
MRKLHRQVESAEQNPAKNGPLTRTNCEEVGRYVGGFSFFREHGLHHVLVVRGVMQVPDEVSYVLADVVKNPPSLLGGDPFPSKYWQPIEKSLAGFLDVGQRRREPFAFRTFFRVMLSH